MPSPGEPPLEPQDADDIMARLDALSDEDIAKLHEGGSTMFRAPTPEELARAPVVEPIEAEPPGKSAEAAVRMAPSAAPVESERRTVELLEELLGEIRLLPDAIADRLLGS